MASHNEQTNNAYQIHCQRMNEYSIETIKYKGPFVCPIEVILSGFILMMLLGAKNRRYSPEILCAQKAK